MEKLVLHHHNLPLFILFFFTIFFLSIHHSNQLQPSQVLPLLKIKELLNNKYPSLFTNWNQTSDFCNIEPNPSLILVCYEDNVTQIHISGYNHEIPPFLPQTFSTESFFSNLENFPTLKVLSLVSLGLQGPLPPTIATLSSLEILNLSSNGFTNKIPLEISSLKNLQTLILDHNMFSGIVPVGLCSLHALSVLSLKNNSLQGSLPKPLSKLQNLRILALSMNHLGGNVPDLRRLINLQVLDLEHNKFGPLFPRLHNKIITLLLRNNSFRLGLPEKLSSFYQLQKLDIGLNKFVGPFSPALLSLPSLNYLDISENTFTGLLLVNMSCSPQIAFVNLSMNQLTGELPNCLKMGDSKKRVVEYGGNCMSNATGKKQHRLLYCQNGALAVKIAPSKHEDGPIHKGVIAPSVVGGLLVGISLCGLVFLVTKRVSLKEGVSRTILLLERVSPAYTLKMLSDARHISETMKMGALGLPPYRTFMLDELKEATSDFHMSNFIGEGSHGQVYKGTLTDGTVVAIRSLKMRKRHSIQTYTHQIELISKLRHCHLVGAIGHCFECYPDDSSVRTIFLIFEFMQNGTLRSYISEGISVKKFTWAQRIAAAIGIAWGIQFLHTGIVPGICSNNLKITDVLLDQNLHVKISSYNLPLLNDTKRSMDARIFSMDSKENLQCRIGIEEKNDVYDLGVILLELILGRAITCENDINLAKDLVQVSLSAEDDVGRRSIIDPVVSKDCLDESLERMMEICVRCLSSEPRDRPSVEDVIWNLQFANQVQDSWRVDPNSNQGSPIISFV